MTNGAPVTVWALMRSVQIQYFKRYHWQDYGGILYSLKDTEFHGEPWSKLICKFLYARKKGSSELTTICKRYILWPVPIVLEWSKTLECACREINFELCTCTYSHTKHEWSLCWRQLYQRIHNIGLCGWYPHYLVVKSERDQSNPHLN